MDTSPAEVMFMALAKTVEAHGTKKRISLFFLSFLSWMDAGALADMMSMALAKTVKAHGTKKHKHHAETTADKLKAIALSKPPSPGSLIKQVQVMSLVDELFLNFDRVFSSNTKY